MQGLNKKECGMTRHWLRLASLTVTSGLFPLGGQAQPRPNILILFADDMGIGDSRVYNNETNFPGAPHPPALPTLETLASQVLAGQKRLAHRLADNGYHTAMFGKGHLGGYVWPMPGNWITSSTWTRCPAIHPGDRGIPRSVVPRPEPEGFRVWWERGFRTGPAADPAPE